MLAARATLHHRGRDPRLFRLGERLALARLATAAQKLPREGQWPAQAALAVQDELATLHADLLASALRAAGPDSAADPDCGAGALERAAQACARSRRRLAE